MAALSLKLLSFSLHIAYDSVVDAALVLSIVFLDYATCESRTDGRPKVIEPVRIGDVRYVAHFHRNSNPGGGPPTTNRFPTTTTHRPPPIPILCCSSSWWKCGRHHRTESFIASPEGQGRNLRIEIWPIDEGTNLQFPNPLLLLLLLLLPPPPTLPTSNEFDITLKRGTSVTGLKLRETSIFQR